MSRRDKIAGGALVAAGVAVGLEASTFDVLFMTDPVGPKALPGLVALFLIGSGAAMVARPRDGVDLPGSGAIRRMVAAAAAFLVYAAMLPSVGFFISTSLVVIVLALLFRGPRVGSVVTGLVLSSALWLLFVALLGLPLPIGSLWIR